MSIDSNMIQRLVNALNRNTEIVALTAGLKDSECANRCGRFATNSRIRFHNARLRRMCSTIFSHRQSVAICTIG